MLDRLYPNEECIVEDIDDCAVGGSFVDELD